MRMELYHPYYPNCLCNELKNIDAMAKKASSVGRLNEKDMEDLRHFDILGTPIVLEYLTIDLFNMNKDLYKSLNNCSDSDYIKAEKKETIEGYKKVNPILQDAIQGKQTIEENIKQFKKRSFKKILLWFLPWFIGPNRAHYKKVKQYSQLVSPFFPFDGGDPRYLDQIINEIYSRKENST